MLQAAPHRGAPCYIKAGDGWALGLQATGRSSPFLSAGFFSGEGCAGVLTGCLYRDEGIGSGDEAAKEIVMAYLSKGPQGVEKLKGSFAAVVVDIAKRRAFGIRSAVGERPLFWGHVATTWAFASEIKELAAAFPARPKPDEEALLDLVSGRFDLPERTPHTDIRRILGGTWLQVEGDHKQARRFWDLGAVAGQNRIPFAVAVNEFWRLLQTAVSRRVARGAGVLLSGGLDSSAVAYAAAPIHRERYGSPLRAISAAYPKHRSVDESRYIKATAARLGCELTWTEPDPKPFEGLDERAWLYDGPDIAPLSTNLRQILAATRQAGVTHALDGHDGDTVLGTPDAAIHELLRHRRFGLIPAFMSLRRERLGLTPLASVRQILVPALVNFVPSARTMYRAVVSRENKAPAWATGSLREQLNAPDLTPPRQRQWLKIRGFQGLTLEALELTALIEGVELCHPFCDPDLVDFLVSIPADTQFGLGLPKSLVRAACSRLPAEVAWRRDKTLFDQLGLEAASPAEILDAARKSSRLLRGIDWDVLDAQLSDGQLPFTQRALLGRVLTCDRWLALG